MTLIFSSSHNDKLKLNWSHYFSADGLNVSSIHYTVFRLSALPVKSLSVPKVGHKTCGLLRWCQLHFSHFFQSYKLCLYKSLSVSTGRLEKCGQNEVKVHISSNHIQCTFILLSCILDPVFNTWGNFIDHIILSFPFHN